jgi:secondary thiamine-phosphate synthase enzyme
MPATTLTISTHKNKQVIDITAQIEQYLAMTGIRQGLCNIFAAHTTAGLTTGEAIEGTDEDLTETLGRMIPKINFRHEHNPAHAPDHMISSILGPTLTIPFKEGKLKLGTWQSVLLVERNGPREREIVVTVIAA